MGGVVYKVTGERESKKTKRKFLLYKLYNLGVFNIAFSIVYMLINIYTSTDIQFSFKKKDNNYLKAVERQR